MEATFTNSLGFEFGEWRQRQRNPMDLESVKKYLEKGGGVGDDSNGPTIHGMPFRFFENFIMQGLHVDHAEKGRVLCTMKVPPRLLNAGNFLHGGATASLVDLVGAAVIYRYGFSSSGVSVEINVSYLDAAYVDEEIEIDARALRVGKTVAVVSVEFRKKNTGKIVAQGCNTKYLAVQSKISHLRMDTLHNLQSLPYIEDGSYIDDGGLANMTNLRQLGIDEAVFLGLLAKDQVTSHPNRLSWSSNTHHQSNPPQICWQLVLAKCLGWQKWVIFTLCNEAHLNDNSFFRTTEGCGQNSMDLESVKKYLEKGGGVGDDSNAPTIHGMPSRFFENFIMQGLRVDLIEKGRVLCTMKVPPRLLNAGNFLHGGATATLVDLVGSAVVYTYGVSSSGVSVEINVSYLDAAYVDEEIEIDARALRVGKTVAVVTVEFRKKNTGKIVAQGRHTKYLPSQSKM
ncbi:hypothetical protein PTKIN_Ptkin08bG0191400 [Pterospermum kingtungense]